MTVITEGIAASSPGNATTTTYEEKTLPAPSPSGRNRIYNEAEVQEMIDGGRQIVIKDGMVLSLDSWAHRHPGGELVILHMVGRDATDEINA